MGKNWNPENMLKWAEVIAAFMPLLMAIIELFRQLPQPKQDAIINRVADAIAPDVPA